MADTVLNIMRARYRLLERTLESLEKQEKAFPEGSINVRPRKYGYSYILHADNRFRYLGKKDAELIKTYIQKDYCKLTIKAAKTEAGILKKSIISYPKNTMENVYDSLPESRKKHATPLHISNNEYAQSWLAAPFERKPFSKDAPGFYTIKGERVRSKSEVIIADRLYAKGIPYKYECPVLIGNEIIHPDFTILRLSDRQVLYHEHCGMMSRQEYADDVINRINQFAHDGIFLGDRLFMTMESSDHPFDISWLDAFIEKNYR